MASPYNFIVGGFFLFLGVRFAIDAFRSRTFTLAGLGARHTDTAGPSARWYERVLMFAASAGFLVIGGFLLWSSR